MGYSWHLKPSRYFPLAASLSLALAKGSQGTEGALANHELSKQNFTSKVSTKQQKLKLFKR
jgi:hypothetical protein